MVDSLVPKPEFEVLWHRPLTSGWYLKFTPRRDSYAVYYVLISSASRPDDQKIDKALQFIITWSKASATNMLSQDALESVKMECIEEMDLNDRAIAIGKDMEWTSLWTDIARSTVPIAVRTLTRDLPYIELGEYRLNRYNHGAPQCPDISCNDDIADEHKPQAWRVKIGDGIHWFYNYAWAKREAEFLGAKIPTMEQWEEMIDWMPHKETSSPREIAKALGIPLLGHRDSDGTILMRWAAAELWSDDRSKKNESFAGILHLSDPDPAIAAEFWVDDAPDFSGQIHISNALPLRLMWEQAA